MKLRGLAACLALCLSATGAHAASLFELFQGMCVTPSADPAKALGAADGMKWGKAPSRVVDLLTQPGEPGEVVTHVDARAARDPNGLLAVAVAQTNRMLVRRDSPAQACIVMAGPSMDVAAISADVASFAAVPSQSGLVSQKGATAYLWREASDGRHSPLAAEEVAAGQLGRDARLLVVMSNPQIKLSVLQFFVPISGN